MPFNKVLDKIRELIIAFQIFINVLCYFYQRAFNELKDYVVSMKSDKDEAPEEKADAAPANVAVLDGKSFEESIKTGIH